MNNRDKTCLPFVSRRRDFSWAGFAAFWFTSTFIMKFRVQKSVGKVLASIFWDQDGILLIDYLPKGQTINAELMSWSPTLFSGSGLVGLPPVPWTEKTTERSPFFFRHGSHCCRGNLVGRTNFWIFLSGLQKLEQRTKKCIELRGEYAE